MAKTSEFWPFFFIDFDSHLFSSNFSRCIIWAPEMLVVVCRILPLF